MATLRQLETFIAVAEYKKMSEAAKHLYISQPTVSQIISDLEKEYNTKLFDRQTKELKATPAGILLLNSAYEIVALHESLERNMQNINSIRPLRIGATITIGNNLMGDLITQLKSTYTDIDPYVSVINTEHIANMLLHNELDIALVEGIISCNDIFTAPAFEDRLCLICNKDHPFAGRNCISIEELKNEHFIFREKGSGTRAIFENIMRTHHIPYRVQWECSSSKAIIDAVKHGLGLGFLSDRCIVNEVANKELFYCTVQEISLKRFFYLCYNTHHLVTSQMQDFINLIKKQPEALKF